MNKIKEYSVNVARLQQLVGVTFSSHIQLFKEVIDINEMPFETYYTKNNKIILPSNDKAAILRVLSRYAILEPVGKRQCYLKDVLINNDEAAVKEYVVDLKALQKLEGETFNSLNQIFRKVMRDKATGKLFDESGFSDRQIEDFKSKICKYVKLSVTETSTTVEEAEIITKIEIKAA